MHSYSSISFLYSQVELFSKITYNQNTFKLINFKKQRPWKTS